MRRRSAARATVTDLLFLCSRRPRTAKRPAHKKQRHQQDCCGDQRYPWPPEREDDQRHERERAQPQRERHSQSGLPEPLRLLHGFFSLPKLVMCTATEHEDRRFCLHAMAWQTPLSPVRYLTMPTLSGFARMIEAAPRYSPRLQAVVCIQRAIAMCSSRLRPGEMPTTRPPAALAPCTATCRSPGQGPVISTSP